MILKETQPVCRPKFHRCRNSRLIARLHMGGVILFALLVGAQPDLLRARVEASVAREDTCDARAYPRIVCEVVVLDDAGLPVEGLDAAGVDIEIEQAGMRAAPLVFKRIEDPAVRDSVLVLIDPGREARAAVSHQVALAPVLDLLEPGAHAALIVPRVAAAAGTVSPARFDPEYDAAFDSDRRARNALARGLRMTAGAPLYDGLCRAADLLAHAPTSPRLLIVISDGRDTRSAVCTADDAIDTLVRGRIPVAALALAAEKDGTLLKRLARDSGGVYVPSAQINTAAERVDALRRRLALRYRIEFDARVAGDALLHMRANGAMRSQRLRIDANARAPEVVAVRLTHDAAEFVPALLPDSDELRTVTVLPQLSGRATRRVEYALGAHVYVSHDTPFTVTLPLDLLDPENPTPLRMTAYADEGASTSYVLQLARRGSAASRKLAPDQITPPKPMLLSGMTLALGGTLMAIVLGVGAWISQRNRAAVLSAPNLRPAVASMRVGTAAQSEPKTVVRGAASPMADRTRVQRPASARLRVCVPGLPECDVPVPADAPVRLGRALTGEHDICARSTFVSGVHAIFEWRDGALYVTDQGSSNGTRHNEHLLQPGQPLRLTAGDRVMCADVSVSVL